MKFYFGNAVDGNCALGNEATRAQSIENRHSVMQAKFGLHGSDLLTFIPAQRKKVTLVDEGIMKAFRESGERPHTEALVTRLPNIAVGVLTADCAPVLLADKKAGLVGAVHVSRETLMDGILGATVGKMCDEGANDIKAYIGPCLQKDHHYLEEKKVKNLLDWVPEAEDFITSVSKSVWAFNFAGCIASVLEKNGVDIAVQSKDNTFADDRYFSYRRRAYGGPTGLQISAIALTKT